LEQQKKSEVITVLISTMDDRIADIIDFVAHVKINYIVIHQVTPGFKVSTASTFKIGCYSSRDDISYIYSSELGLSRSRNIGINSCLTKYAHILDDDVKVHDINNLISLINDFDRYNAEVLISRVITDESTLFKNYPDDCYKYTLLSCASVSSIEMAVNVEFLRLHNINFDKNFGLGTSLPSGEEFIFLTDCLEKGAKIKHREKIIFSHENITSGKDFFSTTNKLNAKKYMFERVFGKFYRMNLALFFLKKTPLLLRNKMASKAFYTWFISK
jgi:glycosyltransferase involved in cell wall biosynthesis